MNIFLEHLYFTLGWDSFLIGMEFDDTKSEHWQRGYRAAQRWEAY